MLNIFDLNNPVVQKAMQQADKMYSATFRSEAFTLDAEGIEDYAQDLKEDLSSLICNYYKWNIAIVFNYKYNSFILNKGR